MKRKHGYSRAQRQTKNCDLSKYVQEEALETQTLTLYIQFPAGLMHFGGLIFFI